nr:ParA family protein [Arenimonas sp.]
MRMILVASSKGGAGKTTVATNLAAHFAVEGKATAILDADRQKSSTHWCEKRAAMDTAVLPLDGSRRGWDKSLPEGIQRLVVDAPAGAMGDDLTAFLDRADAVVVPVLPSMIDLEATVPFLNSLVAHPRVKKGKLPVGIVGNRLKPWTSASQQAITQLKAWPYPLVGELRDTQAYVLLVALGKSGFDYRSEQVRSHQDDWAPLL